VALQLGCAGGVGGRVQGAVRAPVLVS
jgi:hypothetical protein